MRDLLRLLFQPGRTLDDVLFDADMRRSRRVSWLLVLFTSVVWMVALPLLLIMLLQDPDIPLDDKLDLGLSFESLAPVVLGIWALVVVTMIVIYVGSRSGFAWFVRMGIRIAAAEQYPTTPEERADKSKSVALIHPYTLWVRVILNSLLILTYLGCTVLIHSTFMGLQGTFVATLLQTMLNILTVFAGIATLFHLIVLRMKAIQKIYGVSAAQAFWGPFLSYFLFSFALTVLATFAVIAINFIK